MGCALCNMTPASPISTICALPASNNTHTECLSNEFELDSRPCSRMTRSREIGLGWPLLLKVPSLSRSSPMSLLFELPPIVCQRSGTRTTLILPRQISGGTEGQVWEDSVCPRGLGQIRMRGGALRSRRDTTRMLLKMHRLSSSMLIATVKAKDRSDGKDWNSCDLNRKGRHDRINSNTNIKQ